MMTMIEIFLIGFLLWITVVIMILGFLKGSSDR